MLLAGDIGGTKTDLALFSPEGGPRLPLAQREYRSSLPLLALAALAACAFPSHSGSIVAPGIRASLPWSAHFSRRSRCRLIVRASRSRGP